MTEETYRRPLDYDPLDKRELAIRIERNYDEMEVQRRIITDSQRELDNFEASVKGENAEEYISAKNADTRTVLVQTWVQENEDYWKQRKRRDDALDKIEILKLRAERFRLLVSLVDS